MEAASFCVAQRNKRYSGQHPEASGPAPNLLPYPFCLLPVLQILHRLFKLSSPVFVIFEQIETRAGRRQQNRIAFF